MDEFSKLLIFPYLVRKKSKFFNREVHLIDPFWNHDSLNKTCLFLKHRFNNINPKDLNYNFVEIPTSLLEMLEIFDD